MDSTNQIIVTASDPSGNTGEDVITIIRGSDSTPPHVISTYPAAGVTGIAPDSNVVATFSESVDPATVTEGSFTIRSYVGEQITGTISVSESGVWVTFDPSGAFALNGTYAATLTTAIADISGNPMGEAYVWSFETGDGDTVASTIISTKPVTDALDVSLHEVITVTFSEAMRSETVTGATFLLFDADNNPVAGTVSAASKSASFTPAEALAQNSVYTARITTGVRDEAGNAMENEYAWSFTTTIPDTIAPTVVSTSPENNETGVAVDGRLSVVFSEVMDQTTISTSTFLLQDSSGNPAGGTVFDGDTFRPSFNLGVAETYTAMITTGATDLSGNPLLQTYAWDFVTTQEGVGSWVATSTTNAPSPRREATAIWTGQEMIVWGGRNETYLNSGGRYNPVSDSWQTISTVNAPGGCSTPVSAWSGQEMIVWCGSTLTDSRGGRYNPATDTWTPMSMLNAPSALSHSTAIWTGSEMIVWGGYGSTYSNTGGRYNPATDTWQSTSVTGAAAPRVYHSVVWSGSHMIIWGGDGGPFVYIGDTGGRYDPATDSWSPVSSTGAPYNTAHHVAQWSGTAMLVWGGSTRSGSYNPQIDSWSPIGTTKALIDRESPYSAWIGGQMIIWGGSDIRYLNTGASYTPLTDSWSLTALNEAPQGRVLGVSVWTGTEFIVWGGVESGGALTNSGSRYTP
ncbi:MAG: Ig-like domain-containing protein [Pseudomonadota bacterium]